MSAMARFQPWLMAGMASFTLSVGLIGLSLNPAIPDSHRPMLALLGYSSMVLGSLFVLFGLLFIVTIPELRWYFGRSGRCDRAIRGRIELGESLLTQPIVSQEEATNWDALTQHVLRKFLGGEWHPQFRNYLRGGGIAQPVEEYRRRVVSARIHVLMVLRTAIENRSTSIMLNRNIKLS
jgi:hypothetical protein